MLHQFRLSPLFLLLLASFLFSGVLSVPQNVTCDDQDGCNFNMTTGGASLDYIPLNGWTQGNNCVGCAMHPDPIQTYNGTWHDTTLDKGDTSQLMFNITFHGTVYTPPLSREHGMALTSLLGTAVYTYFIFPDNVSYFGFAVTLLANMSVLLDNNLVGNILHVPQNQTNFRFNQLGYANASLSNDTHTLSISPNNRVASSLILFDYYMYTYVLITFRYSVLLMSTQN